MNFFEETLELLKRLARLGDEDAKEKLNDLGVNQTSVSSFATGHVREDLEKCLRLTFEEHKIFEGEIFAKSLLDRNIDDIIPYLCLSAIYATQDDWVECGNYSLKGLDYDDNNLMLLNHLGVAMCKQGNRDGLQYLEKGRLLGDASCSGNFNYWEQRL